MITGPDIAGAARGQAPFLHLSVQIVFQPPKLSIFQCSTPISTSTQTPGRGSLSSRSPFLINGPFSFWPSEASLACVVLNRDLACANGTQQTPLGTRCLAQLARPSPDPAAHTRLRTALPGQLAMDGHDVQAVKSLRTAAKPAILKPNSDKLRRRRA
jgi:hypothetical protein